MAEKIPAPTHADLRDTFHAIREAGQGFIPDSAKFVLNHGKASQTLGKLGWMLVDGASGSPELHQGPSYWQGRKRSRREAYDDLSGILAAYGK